MDGKLFGGHLAKVLVCVLLFEAICADAHVGITFIAFRLASFDKFIVGS